METAVMGSSSEDRPGWAVMEQSEREVPARHRSAAFGGARGTALAVDGITGGALTVGWDRTARPLPYRDPNGGKQENAVRISGAVDVGGE
jgi:hypothetical protein